ncbi:HNH endonuclease [Streptomyces sp. R39]|uniref:HNH endonuclease n=1 Tax=Streptomyces sp. R39 TaxID=3238631 RepID=A0AB39QII6_9ACTN
MSTPGLRLMDGCPKWCTEDHAAQAPADRAHHTGIVHELSLPDGRVAVEASLTMESGDSLPQLVVSGALASFADDVQLLGLEDAHAFNAGVQRFAAHVQQVTDTLRKGAPQPKAPRFNPGQRARSAWRETRLYLAERDGRHCFYCRTAFDTLRDVTIDHYIPKSLWACNLPANLVLSCRTCNLRKNDKLTWSMAAVLLAWAAREGGTAREPETADRPLPAVC